MHIPCQAYICSMIAIEGNCIFDTVYISVGIAIVSKGHTRQISMHECQHLGHSFHGNSCTGAFGSLDQTPYMEVALLEIMVVSRSVGC